MLSKQQTAQCTHLVINKRSDSSFKKAS